MRKIFLFLVITFTLNQLHAQKAPKIKPEANELINDDPDRAELSHRNSNELIKSSGNNKQNDRSTFRKIVKNDSVYVFEKDSLLMRVAAKDWPHTQIAKKIPDESNLEEQPEISANSKSNAKPIKSNDQTGKSSLLMKTKANSKSPNPNTRAAAGTAATRPETQELQ
jgi:hypothetical protein